MAALFRSSNAIQREGAAALTPSLACLTNLTYLDLKWALSMVFGMHARGACLARHIKDCEKNSRGRVCLRTRGRGRVKSEVGDVDFELKTYQTGS